MMPCRLKVLLKFRSVVAWLRCICVNRPVSWLVEFMHRLPYTLLLEVTEGHISVTASNYTRPTLKTSI
jgi:hypothetical protein